MAFGLGLGLMLSVVTMSSFTPEKRAGEIVYLLNSAGTAYTLFSTNGTLPTTGGCTAAATYEACIQRFDTIDDPGVGGFPSGSIPADNIPSNPEAYWAFP